MANANSFIGKKVKITIDRPLGSRHPEHNLIYTVNYGYVKGVKAPDGDDLDAYVLGVFEPVKEFEGVCIAVIHRMNDDDDKLIVVPKDVSYSDGQIAALTEFVERFFKSKIIRK